MSRNLTSIPTTVSRFTNLSSSVLRLMVSVLVIPPFFAQSSSPDLMDSPLTLSLAQTARVTDTESVLVIDQYGIHNTINIIQASDSTNRVDVAQSGNNNTASILQLGIGNVVELYQNGNENGFEIVQDGDFNQANINQFGEQRFIVHQIGNEMVVNITQYKK